MFLISAFRVEEGHDKVYFRIIFWLLCGEQTKGAE